MSVRDLLTFNFFLQFADGLVSYQAFALGAGRSQSRSGRCNGKLGHDWGLIYNKRWRVYCCS
jgi:hypothetical protein